ncbi:MAG: DRTGG domain-containing protein [Thermodesulfobacteriota bacterium]
MSGTQIELRRIIELLDAEILSGAEVLDARIAKVVATDLMSSVLAFSEPSTLLLTGLANVQVVNTANVAGLAGIVFVKGLRPQDAVIEKARQLSLPTLLTPHSMYNACGRLYGSGLLGI